MPGFGAKTLIFEPSCIKAAMVTPDGGSSVLGAQRIVLWIRFWFSKLLIAKHGLQNSKKNQNTCLDLEQKH